MGTLGQPRPVPCLQVGRGMRRVFETARQVAPTSATVLIEGECGTCRELVAEAIHTLSDRDANAFARVHCGALTASTIAEGLFAAVDRAGSGTLVICEIDKLPLPAQARLVDLLQQGTFGAPGASPRLHCRVVATTQLDLRQRVEAGTFREDLYYELSGVTLVLPPLRDRKEDIPLLAKRLLEEFASENRRTLDGFSERALEHLRAYPWPCNDRELERAIESAVVLARGRTIEPCDLPDVIRETLPAAGPASDPDALTIPPGTTLSEAERLLIRDALRKTGGNKQQAARLLGIATRTIYRKLPSR